MLVASLMRFLKHFFAPLLRYSNVLDLEAPTMSQETAKTFKSVLKLHHDAEINKYDKVINNNIINNWE